jgi:biotin operon repressor
MTKNIPKKAQLQAIISKLSKEQKTCANYVLKLFTYFNSVFVTQARIARDIGLSRKTVCKYMKLFHEIGLFIKKRRFHPQFKLSNVYKLAQDFKSNLLDYLKFYFPALFGWSGTPLYAAQSNRVTLRRTMPTINSDFEGACAENSSSSQDFFKNPLPLSIQLVGTEYSSTNYANNFSSFHTFEGSQAQTTHLEWAPSSMEEEQAYNKFIREAEDMDSLADYVEPTTLDEIKSLLTIAELLEWVEQL